MHLVSAEGATGAAQQALLMPMLTRMPKQRAKMLVVSLAPNAVPGAVLRQNGVPVYDVALSKQRFSISAFSQLLKTVRAFRPDVIQAWGHTAQLVSHWLRGRCDWEVKLLWSVANTAALPRKAGFVDRQKLKYAAKLSRHPDRIVYTSEAAASAHRRVGFPESGHTVVPLGVDPTRFKPDLAARRKVREQLGVPTESFVIGMMAPFQPEYDHATLFKAVGELIKTEPNVHVLLAGHGVQKGNGPLMALVGGGTLGTRTQLLGEWSDVASFFNACDLACSSAQTDNGRMNLVIAMLCGVPCVATGMGAQGEVIGQHGVAVEPGSPVALIRGITRVMQLPQDKRVFMAQGARKHALNNFVSIRSLQKYLQLYYDLVGRELTAATVVPVPEIDATIPQPKAEDVPVSAKPKPKTNRSVDMYDLADPDSLEARDSAGTTAPMVEPNTGDVLQIFETTMAKQASTSTSPMAERARGVAEELEDLLAPELIHSEATAESNDAPRPVQSEAQSAQKSEAKGDVRASNVAGKDTSLAASPELAKPSPSVAATVTSAPTHPAPSVSAAAAATTATAPTPAAKAVEPALSLVDTISVSMKISADATGTLEIPSELIFTQASVVRKPTVAPDTQATASVSASNASRGESAQTSNAALTAPSAVAQPAAAAIANAVDISIADSSTVPAIAVDAILSSGMATQAQLEEVSPQLDLLGDPVDQKKAVGDDA